MLKILQKLPLLPVFFLLALGLAGCGDDSSGKSIAVVDAEAVYQKSKLAAAGMAHLDKINADVQARLGQMQAEIMKNPEDLELEQALQSELFDLQTQMDEIQRELAGRVNDLFDRMVEEYRQEKGYAVVLPKQLVIAAPADADITDAVVARLDTKTLDYSDLVLKKKTPAPQPEQTGQPQAQQNGDTAPAQDSGAQAPAASENAPETGTSEAPAQETPEQTAPAQEAQTQDAPAQDSPEQAAPTEQPGAESASQTEPAAQD